MRRVSWLLAVLLLGLSLTVWADCGCSSGTEPSCYATFRSNESIAFSLTVPIDYFLNSGTSETPLIIGWRVETQDGTVVRLVTFDEFKGHWNTFLWDLTDDNGQVVGEGFYRIVVMTTSAGETAADVKVISCCTPCLSCVSCCPCATCVDGRIPRCPTECGQPYLVLSEGDQTRNCCAFTVQIYGSIEFEP
jgi:hypothetical protein